MKKLFRVAALAVAIGSIASTVAAKIELSLVVDPDLTSWLVNTGDEVFNIDAYQITSTRGSLDPAGWHSFAEVVRDGTDPATEEPYEDAKGDELRSMTKTLGAKSAGFDDQLNPSKDILAEVTLQSGAKFQPGAKWSIGKPFSTLPAGYADGIGNPSGPPTTETFTYKLPTGATTYIGPLTVVPEPSTVILAVLGGAGVALAGIRRRRGK